MRNGQKFANRFLKQVPIRAFAPLKHVVLSVCSVNGIFHSIDWTKASVHDNEILKDVNSQMTDSVLIGDNGYIGKELQLNQFEIANIGLETP